MPRSEPPTRARAPREPPTPRQESTRVPARRQVPVPEPSANRRQALIAAAYQRIASQGFEGLRTRDVAADAGVNIATLHYHFPTKEALIRGVIGHAMERFRATLPAHGSAVERLRAHLHALARLVHEDKE